jgi:hypothetical protein
MVDIQPQVQDHDGEGRAARDRTGKRERHDGEGTAASDRSGTAASDRTGTAASDRAGKGEQPDGKGKWRPNGGRLIAEVTKW